MKVRTTTKPCFSCGSEAGDWLNHNCDNCIKGSRLKKDGFYWTKGRCVYQDDIYTQWFGTGSEEIREATYSLTREWDCKKRQEHHKPRVKKDKDKSLNLFE